MEMFQTAAQLVFGGLKIYEWIIIIAILLSWVQPDPSNTLVRFFNRMTLPFWGWVGGRLPGRMQLFSAYVSLLIVWFLQIFLPGTLVVLGAFASDRIGLGGVPEPVLGYFLLGTSVVVRNLLSFIAILMLVWFFMTLINPSINNPIVRTVYFLVDPFITPLQKRLPRGRMDISPLLVAAAFFLINMYVIAWVMRLGLEMISISASGTALPMRTL